MTGKTPNADPPPPCANKVRLRDQEAAERFAAKQTERHGPAEAYLCEDCKGWHVRDVTKRRKKQKVKKKATDPDFRRKVRIAYLANPVNKARRKAAYRANVKARKKAERETAQHPDGPDRKADEE
ncbi:hypothetical protein AB0B94_31185 [Micromonospora sp. NPDC048986]|uniref:hypothetical protein n=1 Tax=Micromonospora sp. NPDC048986 TaxID=3155644 RepID=UPI0033C71D34